MGNREKHTICVMSILSLWIVIARSECNRAILGLTTYNLLPMAHTPIQSFTGNTYKKGKP
jgi:hypothetical protein